MKETAHRPYRQRHRAGPPRPIRADPAGRNDLFEERPWDRITFAAVAERAGVGTRRSSGASPPRTASRAPSRHGSPADRRRAGRARGRAAGGGRRRARATTRAGARRRPHAAPAGRRPRWPRPPPAAPHREWVERVPRELPRHHRRLIGICGVSAARAAPRRRPLDAARSAVADLIAATPPRTPRRRILATSCPPGHLPVRPRPAGAAAPRPPSTSASAKLLATARDAG